MTFILASIAAAAFMVIIVAYPRACSPLWDAVLIASLYVLGIALVVLGVVGSVGMISGLL